MLAAGGISQDSPHQIRGNGYVGLNTARDLRSDTSTNGGNFSFQVANSSLIRVILNNRLDRILFESALLRAQPVLLDLSWNKISLSNIQLFSFGIPRNGDGLESVAQRGRNSFHVIGCADKNHVA